MYNTTEISRNRLQSQRKKPNSSSMKQPGWDMNITNEESNRIKKDSSYFAKKKTTNIE